MTLILLTYIDKTSTLMTQMGQISTDEPNTYPLGREERGPQDDQWRGAFPLLGRFGGNLLSI